MITVRKPEQLSKEQFANLLTARKLQISAIDERYWRIIGQGSIGSKAEQLRRKTWAALQAGFTMDPRVVLAMDFFDGFRRRDNIFDEKEIETILRIAREFSLSHPNVPLVIRSSAYDDAEGTGIYSSGFCPSNENDPTGKKLIEAIKNVLSSEFSESAVLLRKKLGIPDGMAVIIEPAFGRWVNHKDYSQQTYGPILGGLARSAKEQPAYAFLCKGLPKEAVNGIGIRITESDQMPLDYYILNEENRRMVETFLRNDFILGANFHLARSGAMTFGGFESQGLYEQNMSWLFEKLAKFSGLLGIQQYIEWAVRKVGNVIEVGLLQTADCVETGKFDELSEIAENEKTVVSSNYVKRSDRFTCGHIIYVDRRKDLEKLREYNEKYGPHILLINGHIVPTSEKLNLDYTMISNTLLLGEYMYAPQTGSGVNHNSAPEGHFKGLMGKAGIVFCCIEDSFDPGLLRQFEITPNGEGPRVFKVNVECIASEKQQKLVVNNLD
jgi:hypothetical protein